MTGTEVIRAFESLPASDQGWVLDFLMAENVGNQEQRTARIGLLRLPKSAMKGITELITKQGTLS